MKEIWQITSGDLLETPVWDSAYWPIGDERNPEATEFSVTPRYRGLPIPVGTPMMRPTVVSSCITLKRGDRLSGFVICPLTIDGEPSLEISNLQPVVFLPSGYQCGFWTGLDRLKALNERVFCEALSGSLCDLLPAIVRPTSGVLGFNFSLTVSRFFGDT